MKLIDITPVMQEAPIYPGSSPVIVERVCDMSKGAQFNASIITTESHMGAHADAKCHFLPESTVGIDEMELENYYGSCRVVSVAEKTPITKEALEGRIDGCQRVVIHGGGQSYLTKEAAQYIVNLGIRTIVTDACSIAPLDNATEIHEIILGAGLAVVENVLLTGVPDGDYILCAFPIKIGGCDGAPVRAVLIKD